MPITSSELFSHETVTELIVEPLFRASVVLDTLRTVTTDATVYYLPRVNLGTAEFVEELEELPDAAVNASMVQVTPKKVGAIQIVSNEAVNDANAAALIGEAVVSGLADRVDHAAFVGDGPIGPAGFPAISGAGDVDGDVTDLDSYVDAIAQIEEAGGTAGVIFMNPATWGAVQQVKVTEGSRQPVVTVPGGFAAATTRALYGVPVRVSRHVLDGEAWVIDRGRTIAVVREPFTAAVDYSAEFARDAAVVRVTGRVEFASVYPSTMVRVGEDVS